VIGRKAGSVTGFTYGPAMKRANIVWDAQALDKFLADPQQRWGACAAEPSISNRMIFRGEDSPEDYRGKDWLIPRW
jgi:cytochrome c2